MLCTTYETHGTLLVSAEESVYLSFTVIIKFDGIFLQLHHQIVRGHETKVLVNGHHLKIDMTRLTTAHVYSDYPNTTYFVQQGGYMVGGRHYGSGAA